MQIVLEEKIIVTAAHNISTTHPQEFLVILNVNSQKWANNTQKKQPNFSSTIMDSLIVASCIKFYF